jgi:hypothetical protein
MDQMDNTRTIEPVAPCADGKNTVCKVYFQDNQNAPVYVGRAPVPSHLIGVTLGTRESYTGFTAVGA